MAISKEKMQSWAMRMIEEARPPSRTITAIDDLLALRSFFNGGRTILFGMKTTPDAFEDPSALVEEARDALREWFDHFGEIGDAKEQAQLYYRLEHLIEIPEPELVRQERAANEARESAKRDALSVLPRPLDAVAAVSPSLAAALQNPQGGRSEDFFAKYGEALTPKGNTSLDMSNFDWLSADPDWDELVGSRFDAPFFPIAGSDGDYVGVLVFLEAPDDDAVVLYYSHEEGFSFMAESLQHWNAMCDAASAGGRGVKKQVDRARGRNPRWKIDGALPTNAYGDALARAEAIIERLHRGN
ncbi:hypothetical protein [Polyangium sp. y55x31]|uniref:hypothetical protein n=1 Tax=Polyangium sp. y55x31 TaxID=3042688 RepID=UPI002482D1E6|nr:hypothetical protein [Polyangium sp. y55x31]MDI1476736.1 hypothetical protein [Polyangium sp. y55x31]